MDDLIAALQECLKYERTLADCYGGYHAYFAHVRIHRLEAWFGWNRDASARRSACLEHAICRLGGLPAADRYEFELVRLEDGDGRPDPDQVDEVFEYFETSLTEAIDAYARAGDAARDAGDAASGHLCGEHQRAHEDALERIRAKRFKVQLIGAVAYIAHHMHELG